KLRPFHGDLLERLEDCASDHTCSFHVRLLHDDDCIDGTTERPDGSSELRSDGVRGCIPVLRIQTLQLPRRLAGYEHQWFAVGEGAAFRGPDEMLEVHPSLRTERAKQFIAFTIVAAETDGEDLS